MTKEILSILYPWKCPICERFIGGTKKQCCPLCEVRLPFIKNPRCLKCGKPVATEEVEYCMDCTKNVHRFTQGVSLWSYDALVKQAIYRFKYQNRREYADYFAKELLRRYYAHIKSWNVDAIVPVPIHKKRYKMRGFNQAQLLAEKIGQHMKIAVRTELISRVRNTRPQKELSDKERQKNLKSAFKINQNSVKLRKVIVVDDIYTTGATVDTMTELLLQTGITDVFVVTLCIGKGY